MGAVSGGLRRVGALLLVTAWLAACDAPSPDAVHMGISRRPEVLDPRFATDAASVRVCRLLYRGLTRLDEAARPVPDLASWQVLKPRHYRFRLLREGRRFHDGGFLGAEDVVATYRSVLDAATASPMRAGLAKLVERVEAHGAGFVDFHLKRPELYFPARLTLGILPAALARRPAPPERPVGSGPLRFLERSLQRGLALERVADGRRIELHSIDDPVVRALRLVRGELDIIQGDLSAELLTWLRRQPGVEVRTEPADIFAYLGFNLRHAVLGDERVRRAIAHALDREHLVRYLLRGAADVEGFMLAPDHWAAAPDLEIPAYDPARARRLLAAAGYPGGAGLPVLEFKTSTNPDSIRMATALQQQLRKLGIRTRIRSHDWGTFYGDVKAGRFDLYSLNWVGVRLPEIYRYVFHSAATPPAGANRGRFMNARADRLIEAAETAAGAAHQRRLFRELQRHLVQELPYVPLWFRHQVLAVRSGVHGYRVPRDGGYEALAEVRKEPPAP